MKVDCGAYIRSRAIENLLRAQKRAAEEGKTGDVVVLTKLLLKVSERFDKKLLELNNAQKMRVDRRQQWK